jgi:hypothetical protein
MYTWVHEYLAVAWMDIALLHRVESMELQPLPDAAATTWHLIVRGCLLRCGLPWVNLLEASLAMKELPPEGLPLEWVKSFILLCHASCVTLSKE